MTNANLWCEAEEVANEVLDSFSALHPHLRMNRQEWHDLREMIEREVVGRFGETQSGIGARDLLEAKQRPCTPN